MIKEALDLVIGLGRRAHQVDFHYSDKIPDKVFVRVNDELKEWDVPPAHRAHVASGLGGVQAALNDETIAPDPEAFFDDEKGLFAYLDRETRRDQIILPLVTTSRFDLVSDMEDNPRGMRPTDAVALLRDELPDTGAGPLIAALTSIDFTRTTSSGGASAHGKSSLGKSVEAKVIQADMVPEEHELTVPIWSTPGLEHITVKIMLGIFLDPDHEVVKLRVKADQCAAAYQLAASKALEEIKQVCPEGMTLVYGTVRG